MQPGPAPRGDALLVLLRVTATDAIPGRVRAARVLLRRGGETWSGEAKEEMPRDAGARSVDLMVRNGPRWAVGDSLVVLARLERPGRTPVVLGASAVIARVD